MAVYNIVYGSTADRVASITNVTWSFCRDYTGASEIDTFTTRGIGILFSSPNYVINQGFFVFDTSAVPTGSGTGFFSFYLTAFAGNVNSNAFRIREVSSVANKIAGGSLSALTLHSDPGTFPTGTGRYTAAVSDVAAIPRSSTFRVVVHTTGEENNTAPTGANSGTFTFADNSGTTNDPFLLLAIPAAWEFVGVSNVVEVTATPHALVTTGISGLAAGDLLIACISSRIASTTSITLPTGGEWTLVSEQKNNNTASNTSAMPSGLMAYCVRGASNPNLTFTHPVAPSVAIGRIIAYRNVDQSSPKDTQTSFTTATNLTAVSGTGLTTSQIEDLIVAMACGGQEATWSTFAAVTDPTIASGATNTTTAPTLGTWIERADSLTTTGVDTSLAIFDAIKQTAGATGNLTATASIAAAQVVIAGAFKIATGPAAATGTGTPTAQASDVDGAGESSSTGTGTPTAQAADLDAAGISASIGTAALVAEAVSETGGATLDLNFAADTITEGAPVDIVVVGVGEVSWAAIGVLPAPVGATLDLNFAADTIATGGVPYVATLAGVGEVTTTPATGTAELLAQPAAVAGAGISSSQSTSAVLVSQTATVAGIGSVVAAEATGTGVLISQASTLAGAAISESTGTAALTAGAAIVTAAGLSASSGTGSLTAQAATLAGAGLSSSTGTGTLAATTATLSGIGTVASTGTGILAATAVQVAGAGLSASTGTAVLAAQAATLAATGVTASAGIGVLTATNATLAGAAISASTGTGALAADSATLAGIGLSATAGSGALAAQSAVLNAAGLSSSTGTGALNADPATVFGGEGVVPIVGTGALAAEVAQVTGTGLSASSGLGALAAESATISGAGIAASAGTGNLVAQAATVAGEGAASTLVYLRPDGDTVTDDWTDQADGIFNIYQSIDEASANDNDYVQSPATVGTQADLKVRLFDGTTQIVEWVHTDIADEFADAVQTLTTPQVEAIGDFSNLFVEFDDNAGNVYRFSLGDPPAQVAEPVTVRYRFRKLAA